MKVTNKRGEPVPFGHLSIGTVFSGSNPCEELYIKIPECYPKGKGATCNAFNLITNSCTIFGENFKVIPYEVELILK